MIIANGSVLNMAPDSSGWVVEFEPAPGAPTETCAVIGWATVVTSYTDDGARTEIKPAFLWGGQVWTDADLSEHAPEFVAYRLRRPATTTELLEVQAREIVRANSGGNQ